MDEYIVPTLRGLSGGHSYCEYSRTEYAEWMSTLCPHYGDSVAAIAIACDRVR